MQSREVPWGAAPSLAFSARRWAALVLRGLSRSMAASSRRLSVRPRQLDGSADLEFYAEAGAPEGALYANGQLVGRMAGVSRL